MSVHSSPTAWRKEQPWPQQWRNANGPGAVDDSLTNLQWLQEFSILTDDPEKPATSRLLGRLKAPQDADAPVSPPGGDTAAAAEMPPRVKPPCCSSSSPLQPPQDTVDYRTNSQVKPPHSYATLICMAMQASRGAKVTLSTIYAWITENFCYYRQADPSWQNSIRHNLSLNKCFRKVPRRKDEPGKGGFWQIDPKYADVFVNGVFRRRRVPAFPSASAQPSTASSAELGSCRGAGQGQGPGRPLPRLLGPPRRVARGKPPPAPCPSGAVWTGPPSPPAPVGTGPGALSWASALEETLAGGSFEDLELTTALGALATGEGLAPHGHPLGAPSEGGGACPAADPLADGLALCTEPWEEVVAERTLGAPWAFEEGACFAEGFLAEMQPWET